MNSLRKEGNEVICPYHAMVKIQTSNHRALDICYL